MGNYKELIVWQKAHRLTLNILTLAKKFPKSDEARTVKQQLLRSASSIAANIVEGGSGKLNKTFCNHLLIAKRSAAETEYWLLLTQELKYLPPKTCDKLIDLTKECLALLTNFIKKITSNLLT